MLKIGLLGAGQIGREHASLVRRCPAAALSGIADPGPQAKAFAHEIGVPYFSDFHAMLDETQPDGAIVALPNALHLSGGLACIERRIPTLIEKPIADTITAARSLVEESEAASVPVLIGHQRRHSPDIREAKRAISEGLIGDLVTVNGMWLSDKPETYFDVEWRRKPGGGPLLINLIHDLDCLRFICGEIHSVKAFKSRNARGFEVEDTASLAIAFESGALGTFIVSDAVASPFTWDLASGQALYFPHQPANC
jgi:predicted dehydrogenase